MTKRSSVRLLSFGLLLAGILIIYAITGTVQAARYRARLESTYRQSLSALAEDLEGIETDLTKSVYANGAATLSDVSRDLSQQANQAKDSLSRLPVEQMNLAGTYKFLSQTGDYATYLSKKVYAGEVVTVKEHENLLRLLQYATKYKNSVTQMVEICNNGGQITKRDVKSADGTRLPAISTNFSTAEEAFENYPTLLYDGPFADAVLHKEPQLLKGQDKISKDAAAKIAAKALGCNETHLNRLEDEAGRMPAYVFTKGQQTVNVTKSGGYVSSILYGGKISTKAIDEKEAIKQAAAYLKKLGYQDMRSTYYAADSNICTVNFAYCRDGIFYYTDLIKVGVSLRDGSVVSLEARGYITNHHRRNVPTFTVSEKAATAKISPYLEVRSTKKCLIPKEDGREVACIEVLTHSADTGEDALVYLNAATGAEEDILLLLYSDHGTLTK